jgi:simple sugar transport system permease protein
MLIPLLAILTAFIVGGIIIFLAGGNPFLAYYALLQGSLGSPKALSETAVWATPYILGGLGVAFAFKGGLFNIGVEGQLALGATFSALVGYALPTWLGRDIPLIIHLPLTLAVGMAVGALWAAIVGFLKAYTGAHEVINSIMMNYIALNMISYLLSGPMQDPDPANVSARTPLIAESARFPSLVDGFRIHWGFILALLMAFFIWWLLNKSTFGFEVRTVGANPDAAKYAGVNVKRIIILTMALSGMLAGMAGAVEVTGLNFRHELGFAVGYGFDALVIALLGRSNPLGVVLSALLFGAMRNGATRMQFMTQLPVDLITMLQALILLFVAADDIIRYIYRIKAKGDRIVLTRGWGG